MRVIVLIEDPGVIRRVFEHQRLSASLPTERSPPVDSANWPSHTSFTITYHPDMGSSRGTRGKSAMRAAAVPDIAGFAAHIKLLGAAGVQARACFALVLVIDCSEIDR